MDYGLTGPSYYILTDFLEARSKSLGNGYTQTEVFPESESEEIFGFDVVGCGWRKSTNSVFFTHNGRQLSVELNNTNICGYFPVVQVTGQTKITGVSDSGILNSGSLTSTAGNLEPATSNFLSRNETITVQLNFGETREFENLECEEGLSINTVSEIEMGAWMWSELPFPENNFNTTE